MFIKWMHFTLSNEYIITVKHCFKIKLLKWHTIHPRDLKK